MSLLLILSLFCTGVASGGVVEVVKEMVEQFSKEHYGHAVVISFKNSTTEWDVVGGYRNFREEEKVEAEVGDGFLFGSVTKLYTAVSVMMLVEQGVLGLEEPAYPYIDQYLAANQTSLAGLYGEEAKNITIGHLLSMRGGLTEFDTPELREWQLRNPTTDFTPIDILNYLPIKTLRCPPGTCGAYSSIHFTLLGFVLAHFSSAPTWDAYNQTTPFTHPLHFPLHGPLSHQPPLIPFPLNLTHGYIEGSWTDVWDISALGGWTCGNVLASTPVQTQFIYDLFSNHSSIILNHATVQLMLDFKYLNQSQSWNGAYGLGVQVLPQGTEASGRYYGHGGQTYGFETSVGYNEKLDFALSIATNMESEAGWHLGTLHTEIYKLIVADICGAACKDEVSLGCSDQVGFVDEGGAACADWGEYNCTTAAEDYDYTQLGADMLVAHCPEVCEDVSCPPEADLKPYAVYSAGNGYYHHSRLTFRGALDVDISKAGGTIEDCMAACDVNPDCNHFVATASGAINCFLRMRCVFATDNLVPPEASHRDGVPYVTYFKPCAADAADGAIDMWHTGRASFPTTPSNYVWLNTSGVGRAECRELCRKYNACTSYTMHSGADGLGTCFLSAVKVLPETVLGHLYSPLNGSVLGVCAGVSCLAPFKFSATLADCILRCEETQFKGVNASCKAVNYNDGAGECFLHQGIVAETSQLYHEGGWVTWMKEYELVQQPLVEPQMPEGSLITSSLPGPPLTEGWCTDWCESYQHFLPAAPQCMAVVFWYSNMSCALYSAQPTGYTAAQSTVTWTRASTKRSYWKDQSPVGCCTTMGGMRDGLTANECSLLSNRRIFRQGMYCNLTAIPGPEQPSSAPETPATDTTTLVPTLPTTLPTPVPALIPTPAPTLAPASPVPTPLPDTPAPDTSVPSTSAPATGVPGDASEEYKVPFIIACALLFLALSALAIVLYLYVKRSIRLQHPLPPNEVCGEHLSEMATMLPDAVDGVAA